MAVFLVHILLDHVDMNYYSYTYTTSL